MDSEGGIGAIGFYGKLPAKGDFLTRHLPREFVSVWDDWIQDGLNASRGVLGERWQNVYLTSPIWRYALSPGICGDSGWLGLVLPSMDRVGRCFPFSVARAVSEDLPPLIAASALQDWLKHIEAVALAALDDDDIDLSSLGSSLAAADEESPDPSTVSPDAQPGLVTASDLSTGLRLPLRQDLDHASLLREVASIWLGGQFAQHSFWWTEGSQIVAPSLLFCPGLPSADQFCSLLDGSWSSQGWSDRSSSSAMPSRKEHAAADMSET